MLWTGCGCCYCYSFVLKLVWEEFMLEHSGSFLFCLFVFVLFFVRWGVGWRGCFGLWNGGCFVCRWHDLCWFFDVKNFWHMMYDLLVIKLEKKKDFWHSSCSKCIPCPQWLINVSLWTEQDFYLLLQYVTSSNHWCMPNQNWILKVSNFNIYVKEQLFWKSIIQDTHCGVLTLLLK